VNDSRRLALLCVNLARPGAARLPECCKRRVLEVAPAQTDCVLMNRRPQQLYDTHAALAKRLYRVKFVYDAVRHSRRGLVLDTAVIV
jgi:hypothetical protein